MRSRRRASARNAVLVVIALVALVGAAFFAIRPGANVRDEAPDDQFLWLECPDCGKYEVSYREFEELQGTPGAGAKGDEYVVGCKQCGKATAKRIHVRGGGGGADSPDRGGE